MSIPYFYEPTIVAGYTSFTLNETSSKHCVQVLRMKENDRVDITNGKGFLFEAVIINAHKKNTLVHLQSEKFIKAPAQKISVGISLLKNVTRLEWLLEKATEMGMEALGADPKTPTFTYKRPLNEPDVSTWTTVKPNLTKEVSSAADWGTMSGVAGILSRWLYPAVGRAAPFAAGAILPEIAAGAAAGLAVPPIIYGAYKAGEAISDYMYENDPNRTDPSFEGGKRYRVKMPDGFEYTVDPSARGMPYDPEAAAANKKPTLKGDVKAIGREMATGLETEEPDEEKLKMLKP